MKRDLTIFLMSLPHTPLMGHMVRFHIKQKSRSTTPCASQLLVFLTACRKPTKLNLFFFFSPLQSWISMFGAFWQLMQRKTAVTMYFRMFLFNTSFLLENNLVCVVYLNKLNKYTGLFVIRSSSCNQSEANDQDKCLGII